MKSIYILVLGIALSAGALSGCTDSPTAKTAKSGKCGEGKCGSKKSDTTVEKACKENAF